jgi:uncharacterized repeat protein (TIGR02543 family)
MSAKNVWRKASWLLASFFLLVASLVITPFAQSVSAVGETDGIVTSGLALNLDPNLSTSYPGFGTTVTDLSGSGRDGTLAGSPLPTFSSTSPKSFVFTRTYVSNTASTANKITINSKFLTDNFTIQTWIKTSARGHASLHFTTMYIMASECGGGAADWGFGVNSSGQLAFGAGRSDATYSTTEVVNTNTWTNVATTRNMATGEIKLYINGVLKRTGIGNAGNSLNCSADGRTWIGNGQDAPAYSFGGNIGSVLAYTNILSASDILANYEATSGTFYPPTYTMTYNANGATSGSVPANGSYVSGGAATTVSENSGILARTGYSFSGWNSSADGTGTTYAAGSGTYSSNASVTLYAKWAPNSLDVTFDSQSGTLVASTAVQVGAPLAAPVAPTRNGFTFTGWSTTSSGSVVSFPYTHARTSDFTLYAIWTLTPTTTTSTSTTSPPVIVIDIQAPVNTVAQGQESVVTIAPSVSTAAPPSVVVATTTTIANANSAETKSTPTTTVAPIAAPTNSVVAPVIPRLSTGESALDVGGVKTKVDVTRENNQLVISSGSLRAVLSGLDNKGSTRALDADGNLRLTGGDVVKLNVGGFKPGSTVDIWLFSTPQRLGTAKVGADGRMSGSFTIPKNVEDGPHRIAVTAKLLNGKSATFTLGIAVGEIARTSTLTRVLIAIPIVLAIGFGLILPNQLRRRRKALTV